MKTEKQYEREMTLKRNKLLARCIQWIKKHPYNFRMDTHLDDGDTCCIGGLINRLARRPTRHNPGTYRNKAYYDAIADLRLPPEEADKLINFGEWPERFRTPHENTSCPKKKSKIAIERLRYFIRKGV